MNAAAKNATVDNATADNDVQSATPQKARRREQRPRRQPRYHVILWNDDDHTYDYVVRMMQELFGHPPEMGLQIALTVDSRGKAICLTTTLEHAELKRDQIHAYGKDMLIASCCGSMSATIEPAPE